MAKTLQGGKRCLGSCSVGLRAQRHAVLEVTGAGRRAPYCTFAVRLCSVDEQNVSRSSANIGAVVVLGRESETKRGRNDRQVSDSA